MVQHVRVNFSGAYKFIYAGDTTREITFTLRLLAARAIYDDIVFSVNGVPLAVKNAKTEAYAVIPVQPHGTVNLEVGYRSQGMGSGRYDFGDQVTQVRDFQLRVTTDFRDYDLLENTLSPTERHPRQNGWQLVWDYKNLVSGYQIGLAMPAKLQPGPLAGRISYFAPVSLLFFFFVLFVLTTIRGIELHPMNYFFLACAFFFVSPADGVPGGSHLDSCSICSVRGHLDFSGGELFAARGRDTVRGDRGGTGATHLPRVVFVRVFLPGIHGTDGDDRSDHHAVRGDVDDRANPMDREIRTAQRAGIRASGGKIRCRSDLGGVLQKLPGSESWNGTDGQFANSE